MAGRIEPPDLVEYIVAEPPKFESLNQLREAVQMLEQIGHDERRRRRKGGLLMEPQANSSVAEERIWASHRLADPGLGKPRLPLEITHGRIIRRYTANPEDPT